MSNVEPWRPRVVVDKGHLKAQLFPSAVGFAKRQQVRALHRVLAEAEGDAPTDAPYFIQGPSPFSAQQMVGRFNELSRPRVDPNTGLSLEGELFVQLPFQVEIGQSKEGVGQIGRNRVSADEMFVVHHIADPDFSGISKSRLGIDLAVVGLVEVGAKRCLLYTSPSPRDRTRSRMPSSA